LSRPLALAGAACAAWIIAPTALHLAEACWHAGAEGAHGPLVLGLSGWILWRERSTLARRSHPWPIAGTIVAVLALWVLLAARPEHALSVEVPCAVLAVAGLLVARRGIAPLRVAAFPLLFIILSPPMPIPLAGEALVRLKLFSASIAAHLIDLSGTPIVQVGSALHLPGATLEVDETCSGLRGLTSIVAVAALYAYFAERQVERVVALVLAVPVALLANVLRIIALCALATSGSPAGEVMHAALGLGVYLVALGALAGVARTIPAVGGASSPRPAAPALRPSRLHRVVEVVLLSVLVVVDLSSRHAAGPRAAASRPLLARVDIDGWSSQPLPLSPRVAGILRTDDVEAVRFVREADVVVDVVVVRAAGDPWRAFHPPDTCFLNSDFVLQEEGAVVIGGEPVNRQVYRRGADGLVVYHWYEVDGGRVTDRNGFRLATFRRRLVYHRESEAVLVRASARVANEAELVALLARAGARLR
jgi:EpsI family protein